MSKITKAKKTRRRLEARLHARWLQEQQLNESLLWPDDTGFKPPKVDPLLHGQARASGIAAKVVKRGNTITRFQYQALREKE